MSEKQYNQEGRLAECPWCGFRPGSTTAWPTATVQAHMDNCTARPAEEREQLATLEAKLIDVIHQQSPGGAGLCTQ